MTNIELYLSKYDSFLKFFTKKYKNIDLVMDAMQEVYISLSKVTMIVGPSYMTRCINNQIQDELSAYNNLSFKDINEYDNIASDEPDHTIELYHKLFTEAIESGILTDKQKNAVMVRLTNYNTKGLNGSDDESIKTHSRFAFNKIRKYVDQFN